MVLIKDLSYYGFLEIFINFISEGFVNVGSY